MKRITSIFIALAVSAGMVSSVSAQMPPHPDRVRGKVTAVDTHKKTITVTGRDGDSTTIKFDGATKFHLAAPGALSDLKVGQSVRVMGDQTNPALYEARMIMVVPKGSSDGPPKSGHGPGGHGQGGQGAGRPGGPGGPGGGGHGLKGVITKVKPKLMITTDDKKTVTVNTKPDTRIFTSKDAHATNVKVDGFIMAQVTGKPGSQVAKDINVMPAGGMRGMFGGHGPGGGRGPGGDHGGGPQGRH